MRELDGLINLDQMTVNGKTHRQNVERVVEHNPEVIRPVSDATATTAPSRYSRAIWPPTAQ